MATFGNFETTVEPIARLMRDHIETHQLVERTQDALDEALRSPDDPGLVEFAMDMLAELDAHLAIDLVIHIAKEEEVLFPALVGFGEDLDKVISEMVEQHDEVRLRKANLERALQVIRKDHEEVEEAQSNMAAAISAARTGLVTPTVLESLLDAVKRLRWILEGHFGDEEDDLFPPAVDLLPPGTWDELARRADELHRQRMV